MTDSVLRKRIATLEKQLAEANAWILGYNFEPPSEWGLKPQESIFAKILAKGPAFKSILLIALENDRPAETPRNENHVQVILCHLRKKILKFGWKIPYSGRNNQKYSVITEQIDAFHLAMTGEGNISYPSKTKARA